jgi:glycosyltransferase involved in cell wall biosynthesis
MSRTALILTHAYPPLARVGAFRIARFAKYLPDSGWRPLVVTMRPEAFHAGHADASLNAWTPADAHVVRTDSWRPPAWLLKRFTGRQSFDASRPAALPPEKTSATAGFASAVANGLRGRLRGAAQSVRTLVGTPDPYWTWACWAIRASLSQIARQRVDIILASGPPHSVHLMALALKALTGLPLVIDFRDPWAHNPWAQSQEGWLRNTLNVGYERLCVETCDGVILNTPSLLADFQNRYRQGLHARFAVLPNGYDPDLLSRASELEREAPPANGMVRICHAGAVYGRRDLRPLITGVARFAAAGQPARLELLGTIDDADSLRDWIREQGWGNIVSLVGQTTHDEALRRTAAADVLIAIRNNTRWQVPAKLYEMLAFHKPIVILDDDGAAARFVSQYELGLSANPADPEEIATALGKAIEQRSRFAGGAGRDLALRTFNGRRQVAKLASILTRAVHRAPLTGPGGH